MPHGEIGPPLTVLEALQEINENLRFIRGGETIVTRTARTQGVQDHVIQRVSLTGGALTEKQVTIAPTRILTFLNWPTDMRKLQVRLNHPQGPVFDILVSGNKIVSENPINQIFITTSDVVVSPLGDTETADIHILSGSIVIEDHIARSPSRLRPDIKHGNLNYTLLAAADRVNVVWPLVPSGETWLVDMFSVGHDSAFPVDQELRIERAVGPTKDFFISKLKGVDKDDGVNHIFSRNSGQPDQLLAPGPFKVYSTERLELIFRTPAPNNFAIGDIFTIGWRYEVLPDSLTYNADLLVPVVTET